MVGMAATFKVRQDSMLSISSSLIWTNHNTIRAALTQRSAAA
jgi:hypothetical protein